MPNWIPLTRLYGLTRDELRYILDPKEVHGDDPSIAKHSGRRFLGEMFHMLKEKEVKAFGDASRRTSRLANAASGGVGWVSWIVE